MNQWTPDGTVQRFRTLNRSMLPCRSSRDPVVRMPLPAANPMRLIAFLATATLLMVAGTVLARPVREIHTIRLTANRFTPADFTVKAGDSLRFINGPGGLHTVAFRENGLAPAVRRLLDAAMPGREVFNMPVPPLSSPLMIKDGEVYAFSMPALPPGQYEYFCDPHVGAGMKGTITVVP